MNLTYVPVLGVQRELQGMPRGMERFRAYIDTVTNDARDDLALPPLGIMNPMAKDHITEALDVLLAMDADAIGARAAGEASALTADTPGHHKASLVLADEQGGWTNRWTWEHDLRFGRTEYRDRTNEGTAKRFWVTGVLWSGDDHTPKRIREAILTAALRAAYAKRHGPVRTLRDMLVQEGTVLAGAGCTEPSLPDDEIEYTREVIAPVLDATEMRTAVEYVFGDDASRACGFTPRGLSPWAGIALALHDARCPTS